MPRLLLEQRSPEWFEARRGRITASLAAACLGLDPHKGPLAAYNLIAGLRNGSDAPNKHMAWGVEFEDRAKDAYEVLAGSFVQDGGFWVHPLHDWLAASPDALVGVDGLAEIKCPGRLPTAIPPHHRVQMMVQMACTERDWCDYYAWSPEGEFCRRLLRDGGAETALLTELQTFYDSFLAVNIPPPRRRPKPREVS